MRPYRLIPLDLDDPIHCQRWDLALPRLDPHYSHYHRTSILRPLQQNSGHQNLCVMVEALDCAEIVGVMPLFLVKSLFFGSYMSSTPAFNYGGARVNTGNIAEDRELRLELYRYAIAQADHFDVAHMQFRDDASYLELVSTALAGQWQESTEKANLILQIPATMQEIGEGNAKKRQKLRSQAQLAVRKSEEEGITLRQVFGSGELLDDFYQVFSRHMRDLGTPVYSKEWFRTILQANPGHATLTVVYLGDEPMSCGFLLHHADDTYSIPWASALKTSNPYSLNTHMYWNIIDWIRMRGGKVFDFGRSSIDAGTFAFKRQWGAEPVPCHWLSWSRAAQAPKNLSPSNKKFNVAITLWKKMPVWLTNLLGPGLASKLP